MPSASGALLFVLGLPPLLEEAEQRAAIAETMPSAMALEQQLGLADVDETDDMPVAGDAGEAPIVTDLASILEVAAPTEQLTRPRWIRHRVRPRERVTQIAARYGVSAQDVIEWNRLDPKDKFPKGYWRVRVRAHQIPPPRMKVRYVVAEDDSWGDIAAKFRVEQPDLRSWNWQRRKLFAGRELEIWVDPGAPQTLHPGEGPMPPDTFEVPQGAMSKGYPDRGRLIAGVKLPASPLYTKRHPEHGLYGSTHTILQLQRAIATFRHDSGYEGEIVIGAISRRKGGRFSPHKSHQSGRDVDIRLPRLPGVPDTLDKPNPDEIDWHATWALVEALDGTGQVRRIFLDVELHRRLYEAARQLGASREDIARLLPWPSWDTQGDPVIRHSRGHTGHIHVRFDCGPDEPKCKRRRRR